LVIFGMVITWLWASGGRQCEAQMLLFLQPSCWSTLLFQSLRD
jgi:hypothetical protein